MRIYQIFATISSVYFNLLVVLFCSILFANDAMAQQRNFDTLMREYGMVNIKELDSEILVELKYSTEDNFVGRDMYGDLEDAYLEKEFGSVE